MERGGLAGGVGWHGSHGRQPLELNESTNITNKGPCEPCFEDKGPPSTLKHSDSNSFPYYLIVASLYRLLPSHITTSRIQIQRASGTTNN